MNRRLIAITVAAAVAAFGVGAIASVPRPSAPEAAEESAVITTLKGLDAPQGEPELDGFASAQPQPGTVTTVEGPFDDRFELHGVALGDKSVEGELSITSDVSELIELVVVAGFYDKEGELLDTATFVHHGELEAHSGSPSTTEEFSIDIPAAIASKVESAAIGVPVLVNE